MTPSTTRERDARQPDADQDAAREHEEPGRERVRHQREAGDVEHARSRPSRGRRRTCRRACRRTAARRPRPGSARRARARRSRGPSRGRAVIGCRNRPKPCRRPSDSVRMRPPHTSTAVGRAPVGAGRRGHVGFLRSGERGASGWSDSSVGERRDQRVEPRRAELAVRPRPARASRGRARRRAPRGPARVIDTSRVRASRPRATCDVAGARPAGRALRDSAVRSISSVDASSVTRIGAEAREVAQQRELGDAQPAAGERVVVELRERARRAAQPPAGACRIVVGSGKAGVGRHRSAAVARIGAYARECECMHLSPRLQDRRTDSARRTDTCIELVQRGHGVSRAACNVASNLMILKRNSARFPHGIPLADLPCGGAARPRRSIPEGTTSMQSFRRSLIKAAIVAALIGVAPSTGARAAEDRQGRRAAFAVRHDGDQRDRAEGRRADGVRRDQRQGRRDGPQDRGRRRRPGVELAAVRREGAPAHLAGQGRGGVRLLDRRCRASRCCRCSRS